MNLNRKKHWQFLEDEVKAETEDFKKIFLTTAISLLRSDEMFVAQFVSFKNGEMIMKFPNTRALPRKGEYLVCMVLPPQLQSPRSWGDKTYRDLYKERNCSTECVCIWSQQSDSKEYSLVGFRNVSVDFANYIKDAQGIVLTFAPQRPPIDYVMNLQRVIEDELSDSVSSILDANFDKRSWKPILIKQDNVSDFVNSQLNLSDTMILQGPPGTGKTYMIAELCAKLCAEGKSVLVTALTNRALIEIAEKPMVEFLLNERKLFKTNITVDELREIPKLTCLKNLAPMPSCLVMSTFYITSGLAADISLEQPFDYVIMDEASQALLAMFAASKKLGKKNLWVGDIKQLSPIISLNGDRVKLCGYRPFVDGLMVLADNSSSPIYQLTSTFRFGQRAADYTGIFYDESLRSKKECKFIDLPSISKLVSQEGGPSLILTDMPSGDTSPQFAMMLAAYIVNSIRHDDKSKEIAVLTCMHKTVRALQKTITQHVGASKNVLIDTVARVQGLTTDITIFFVPDNSIIRTLEPHLFNVATSRAKEHTIIIVDKYVFDYPTLDREVRVYLERLRNERSLYVPDPSLGVKAGADAASFLQNWGKYLLPEH